MQSQVKKLLAEGKIDDALAQMKAGITQAREDAEVAPEFYPKLIKILEFRGAYFMEAEKLDAALQDFQEALSYLDKVESENETKARILTRVARIFEHSDQGKIAKAHYENALLEYEKMEKPPVIDYGRLANRLSFAYAEEEDFDMAETVLLKGLKAIHEEFGFNHHETADYCNNLGAIYMEATCYNEACNMHTMALRARLTLYGPNHPDTAQSHGNLAAALAASENKARALVNFTHAVDAYKRLSADCHPDFLIVLINYERLLLELGKKEKAERLRRRYEQVFAL